MKDGTYEKRLIPIVLFLSLVGLGGLSLVSYTISRNAGSSTIQVLSEAPPSAL